MRRHAATRESARVALLELLERRHGVGARAGRVPGWVAARLDRVLDAMVDGPGGLDGALARIERDAAHVEAVAEALRVGETAFYRDPRQWQALREWLPRFERPARLRALSVGCSTGEEAWTLAMLLDDALPGDDTFRVVGMDRSELGLASAGAGEYPVEAARHLPADLRARYVEPVSDGVAVCAALRARVSFVVRDLVQGPPPGSWELIVCKNVLIYFGDEAAERAVRALSAALADDGILLVASSEVPRLRALGCRAIELGAGVTGFGR